MACSPTVVRYFTIAHGKAAWPLWSNETPTSMILMAALSHVEIFSITCRSLTSSPSLLRYILQPFETHSFFLLSVAS